VESALQQLDYLALKLARAPSEAEARLRRRFEQAAARLAPALQARATACETRLQRAALRLEPPVRAAWQRAEAAVRHQQARLHLLNPYAVLERGYSITTDAQGRVVRTAAEVKAGEVLTTRLSDGTVTSVVREEA
jgi:exodeoxyribonuclease VII large subunit